ncbi:MAG: carboxypeptidase-like regulatory domain-containing protein [Bacteroidota bacterium]
MKKELIIIIVLSFFVCVLGFAGETPKLHNPKTLILSGKITDLNNNESLAGVKIECTDCSKTIYSDLNGNFFVYLEITSNNNTTIEFSQIGYSSKTYSLKDLQSNSGNLSINLSSE